MPVSSLLVAFGSSGLMDGINESCFSDRLAVRFAQGWTSGRAERVSQGLRVV